MRTINNLLQASLKIDLSFQIENVLTDTAEDFVDLQKDQMLHGLNSQGEKIGKYRNKSYADKKAAMNELAGYGNVDLKLTGSFYQDIFTDVRTEGIVVDSADSKSGQLQEKYRQDIFGLNDENKSRYAEIVQPILINNIEKSLNGTAM